MKNLLLLIVSACLLSCAARSRPITTQERNEYQDPFTEALDVNSDTFYGVLYGSTEDEIVKALGKPDGFIVFSPDEKGLVYSRSKIFLLHKNSFYALRITDHFLDFVLSEYLFGGRSWSLVDWSLSNGIHHGMPIDEAKKILGTTLEDSDFGLYFRTTTSNVLLTTATYKFPGRDDEKKIDSLFVRMRKSPRRRTPHFD